VGFVNNNTNGNSKFNIQFVKIGDPTADVISAPGNPVTGTPPTTDPDTAPWSIPVVFAGENQLPAGVTIESLAKDYQAQVQAEADTPNAGSHWGMQIYYHVGLTISVLIGGVKVVLAKSSIPDVYSLQSPVKITYADLQAFVIALPGGLQLPTTWPNGDPISSSLTLQTFDVNTQTKLFDINVVVNLDWTIIQGSGQTPILVADEVGIEVIRTNGQPII
jgi:hypothetical protein